jgi:hypothetical protein
VVYLTLKKKIKPKKYSKRPKKKPMFSMEMSPNYTRIKTLAWFVLQVGPSPNEFNHPIEGALMMTMRDEYVRWALKPPFGGHYGGLFTPAWKAFHNIALLAGQESAILPMEISGGLAACSIYKTTSEGFYTLMLGTCL